MARRLIIPTINNSTTFATWDPVQSNGTYTITSGLNLVNGPTANNQTINATIGGSITGKSSNKWYWEITAVSGFGTGIGVTSGVASSFSGNLGSQSNGYALFNFNSWYAAGALTFFYFSLGIAAGDVIGVALNAGANTITFYENGTQATPDGTLTGSNWLPAVSNNSNGQVKANFGQNPFAYTPPVGYQHGFF